MDEIADNQFVHAVSSVWDGDGKALSGQRTWGSLNHPSDFADYFLFVVELCFCWGFRRLGCPNVVFWMVVCGQLVVFCVAGSAARGGTKNAPWFLGLFSQMTFRRGGLPPGIANGQPWDDPGTRARFDTLRIRGPRRRTIPSGPMRVLPRAGMT